MAKNWAAIHRKQAQIAKDVKRIKAERRIKSLQRVKKLAQAQGKTDVVVNVTRTLEQIKTPVTIKTSYVPKTTTTEKSTVRTSTSQLDLKSAPFVTPYTASRSKGKDIPQTRKVPVTPYSTLFTGKPSYGMSTPEGYVLSTGERTKDIKRARRDVKKIKKTTVKEKPRESREDVFARILGKPPVSKIFDKPDIGKVSVFLKKEDTFISGAGLLVPRKDFKIGVDITNTARIISLYNKKAKDYSSSNIFSKNSKIEKQLDIEKEKLSVVLKQKYPKLNTSEVLFDYKKPVVQAQSTEYVEEKIYMSKASPKESVEVLNKISKQLTVEAEGIKNTSVFYAPLYDDKGNKLEVDKSNKFLQLEEWQKESNNEIDARREKVNVYSEKDVNAFNDYIKSVEKQEGEKISKLEKEVDSYNLLVGSYQTKEKKHLDKIEVFNKPLIKRQKKIDLFQKQIKAIDEKIKTQFFVDKTKLVPRDLTGIIPESTVMPAEEVVTSERKREWYSKFIPDVAPKIPFTNIGLLPDKWTEDYKYRQNIKERQNIIDEYSKYAFPDTKFDLTKVKLESKIVVSREPDASEIYRLGKDIEEGKLKITGENVGYITDKLWDSKIYQQQAMDKSTSYEYYRDAPVTLFIKKRTDKIIADKLAGQIDTYHTKEAAKTGATFVIAAAATAGIGEVFSLAAKVPKLAKAVKIISSKPVQGGLWGLYGIGKAYSLEKDIKNKDYWGIAQTGAEIGGVVKGVQWLKATGGRPYTKTFIDPVRHKIAMSPTDTSKSGRFYRWLGKKQPYQFAEWTYKPGMYESTFGQKTLFGTKATGYDVGIQNIRVKQSTLISKKDQLQSLLNQKPGFKQTQKITTEIQKIDDGLQDLNKDLKKLFAEKPFEGGIGGKQQIEKGYISKEGDIFKLDLDPLRPFKLTGDPGYVGPARADITTQTRLTGEIIEVVSLESPGVTRPLKVVNNKPYVLNYNKQWMEIDPKQWALKRTPTKRYGIDPIESDLTPENIIDLNLKVLDNVYTDKVGNIVLQIKGISPTTQTKLTEIIKTTTKVEDIIDADVLAKLVRGTTYEKTPKIKGPVKISRVKGKKHITSSGEKKIQETDFEKLIKYSSSVQGQKIAGQIKGVDPYSISGMRTGYEYSVPSYKATTIQRPGVSKAGKPLFPSTSILSTMPGIGTTLRPSTLTQQTKQFQAYRFYTPVVKTAQEQKQESLIKQQQFEVADVDFAQKIAQYVGQEPIVDVTQTQPQKVSTETAQISLYQQPFAQLTGMGAVGAGAGIIRASKFPLMGMLPLGFLRRGYRAPGIKRGVREWTIENKIKDFGGEWMKSQIAQKKSWITPKKESSLTATFGGSGIDFTKKIRSIL